MLFSIVTDQLPGQFLTHQAGNPNRCNQAQASRGIAFGHYKLSLLNRLFLASLLDQASKWAGLARALVDLARALVGPERGLAGLARALADLARALVDPARALVNPARPLADLAKGHLHIHFLRRIAG